MKNQLYFLLKLHEYKLWYCGNGLFTADKEEAEKYFDLDSAEISQANIKSEYKIKTIFDCYDEEVNND